MRKLLISFLGTGGGKTTTGQATYDYKESTYRWPNGKLSSKQPFFGFALQEELKPHLMLILGTEASMWATILLYQTTNNLQNSRDYSQLLDRLFEKQGKTTLSDELPALAQTLSSLKGTNIHLQLIPTCTNRSQMIGLFSQLVSFLKEHLSKDGIELHLDITHTFRHIPLITMTAITYITTFYPQVKVGGIYYAAFERKSDPKDANEPAPIVDLLPTWEMLQWYHAARDYLVFGRGDDLATLLHQIDTRTGDFFQEVNYTLQLCIIGGLSSKFNQLKGALGCFPHTERAQILEPMIPELQKMCSTLSTEYPEWQNQIYIAQWYYQRQMYQQALTALLEAFDTFAVMYNGYDCSDYAKRVTISKKSYSKNNVKEAIPDETIQTTREDVRVLRNHFNHAGLTSSIEFSKSSKIVKGSGKKPVALAYDNLLNQIRSIFDPQRIEHLVATMNKCMAAQENKPTNTPEENTKDDQNS